MANNLKIEEYTDVLTHREIDRIYLTLISDIFPWYCCGSGTVNQNWYDSEKDNNTKEYLQLVHQFNMLDGTPNSDFAGMTDHILTRFLEHSGYKLKKLFKVKANFQPKVETFGENYYNTPHIDKPDPHYVLLYYPHDADGDTRIFEKSITEEQAKYNVIKQITPSAGKYLFFDGSLYHSGAHPTKSDSRIVINFNFEIE